MFDPAKKFVRVTQLRSDGFVEFDFAVGEPEVFVELILPAQAFDEFCAMNKVAFLEEGAAVQLGTEGTGWRLRDVNRLIAEDNEGGQNH